MNTTLIVIIAVAAPLVAGVLMAIGFTLGRRGATSYAIQHTSRLDIAEAKVDMLRKAVEQAREEIGSIYSHMQATDVDFQKRLLDDLKGVDRMMHEQQMGGPIPPKSPTHPPIGSRMVMQ